MFYWNTLYLNERVSKHSQASLIEKAFWKEVFLTIYLFQYVCFEEERFLFKTFSKMQ